MPPICLPVYPEVVYTSLVCLPVYPGVYTSLVCFPVYPEVYQGVYTSLGVYTRV